MAGGNLGHGFQGKLRGNVLSFPVKIATAIYRGTAVAIDSAGYLIQAGDGAAMKFVGIAEEGCTAAEAVADGTMNIKVRRHGIFRMTKQTTSAVTDLGLIAYAHTTHTSSVQGLIGLAAACTYDNAVGLVVGRAPDTPGGSTYTSNYLMVDITPSPWSLISLTTHAALADQTAHADNAIAPTLTTESGTSPTITAAEFYGRAIACTYAGVVAFTLPTSGITAGTICRVMKSHATAGALTITGGTLVGPNCATNVFVGCPNNGDSVDIMCVGANSYRVVNVHQQLIQSTEAADATLTAAEWMGGIVLCSKGSAQAISLPASGVPINSICILKNTGSAHARTISATSLVGGAASTNAHATMDAVGDSIIVLCTADDTYTVIGEAVA